MKLTRRGVMLSGLGAASAAALAYGLQGGPRPRPRGAFAAQKRRGRPNILLILTDQERGWDLYPDGFIERHCPGRQRLKEAGVFVTGAHTPVQLCSMARGVLYSGQHSQNNGVWENTNVPLSDILDPSAATLGTLMQDAGYVTGYEGKWHLSRIDQRPSHEARAEIAAYGFEDNDVELEINGAHQGFEYDSVTVKKSLRFVHRRRGDERPWFLAVNFLNPHDVMFYTANEKMTRSRVTRYPDESLRPPQDPLYSEDLGYDVYGRYGPDTLLDRPPAIAEYGAVWENLMGALPYGDMDIARDFQNYYWNCVRDCDRHLQSLLDGLAELGALDNTIILFTSDHGEFLGVHGLRGKGVSGYREGSKVPMVISHPDGFKGETSERLVSHVDVTPTLLGFAGVERSEIAEQFPELVGHDLSEITGSRQPSDARQSAGLLLYWTGIGYLDRSLPRKAAEVLDSRGLERALKQAMTVARIDWNRRGHMRGVYDGRWKFCRYFRPDEHHAPATWDELIRRNDIELYDTQEDPEEVSNVARDARVQPEVERLNQLTNSLIDREIGRDDGGWLPWIVRN